jgi:hypothetical protein
MFETDEARSRYLPYARLVVMDLSTILIFSERSADGAHIGALECGSFLPQR